MVLRSVRSMLTLPYDRVPNGVTVVSAVEDVAGAFTMALTGADVDDGRTQISRFPNPHGTVPDKYTGAPHNGQKLGGGEVSGEVNAPRACVFASFADTLSDAGLTPHPVQAKATGLVYPRGQA